MNKASVKRYAPQARKGFIGAVTAIGFSRGRASSLAALLHQPRIGSSTSAHSLVHLR